MIHDDDGARRLAKAILADIRLYNDGRFPSDAVDEGRGLFRGRVAPALHGVFDEELAAFGGASPSPNAAPAQPVTMASRVEVEDGAGILRLAVPIILAIGVFAIGAFLAFMR